MLGCLNQKVMPPGLRGCTGLALTTFESARDQLKNEESKLPFLANATGIYDDYIHFLVAHHKTDEALALADDSRARTLEQGLGVISNSRSMSSASFPSR